MPNFQEGKHLQVGTSVEHAAKPLLTGYFDYGRQQIDLVSCLVEANPNGAGARMTEIRIFDMGNAPGLMITAMANGMPPAMHKVWVEKVEKRLAGKI
mgnify:CR=1 FL=1